MSHAAPDRVSGGGSEGRGTGPSRGLAGRHGAGRRRAGQHADQAEAGNAAGQPAARRAVAEQARANDVTPARNGQVAYLAVLIGVAIALLIIGQGVHLVRSGTLVLAGVLLVAAMARLILPERLAGLLSSRRRLLDVAIFALLGVGLLVAGLVVPVPG
jgi:Protein of unknown function (DUF3017)